MPDPFSQSANFVNPDYATPEQVAAQRAYANYLTQNQQPVTGGRGGWAIGLSNMVNALMGGVQAHQADIAQRQALGATGNQMSGLIQMLRGQSSPQVSDNSQPRGLRNNNPGNIEDGSFAKSQEGYQGSDGRFAKFASLEHGQQAMANLLQNYGNQGINTVSGVINKWAPPSDNNPTNAYAATVAKALGTSPNAQINLKDPQTVAALSNAIGGFENGRPVPQASPQNAQTPIGGGGQPQQPQQIAQNAPIDARTAGAALVNPWMPDIASKMIGQSLSPQFGAIGTDQYGNPIHGFINPIQRSVTPAGIIAGKNIGTIGQQEPTVPQTQTVSGEEYLKSLDPEKANLVKSIAEGRAPYPSGFLLKTPYGQWLQQAVSQYEPGIDSTLIKQRQTFNQQLGSASPSSVGGQKNLIGTSLGHLSQLAERAADLGNVNTPLAPLGQTINQIRNLGTMQAAKVQGLNETADRFAGEVGKLYSGSSGGGVNEREDTRRRFGGDKTSLELAAGLEAGRDLIASKMDALENQASTIFGPNRKFDFIGDHGRAAIAKINESIAKLKKTAGQTSTGIPSQESTQPKIIPWVRRSDGTLGPAQ